MTNSNYQIIKRYLLFLQLEKRLEINTINSYWYDLKKYVDFMMIHLNRNSLNKINRNDINTFIRTIVYKSKYSRLLENNKYPINEPPWGTLNAINLNTGKLLWKVPLGNYEEFNIDNNLTGTENFGGTTVTRGGIAITSGTLDKKIYFHDIENGNLILPLRIEEISDIKAEVVASGPAPSP